MFSAPYAKDADLKDFSWKEEAHIIIAQYIMESEQKGARIRPSELFELLDENSEEFNAILDLNYGDKLTGEIAERFFTDSVKTLKKEAIEEEILILNKAYAEATDEGARKEIAQKLSACIRKQNALKKS